MQRPDCEEHQQLKGEQRMQSRRHGSLQACAVSKLINSGGNGRNYGCNSGNVLLVLPLRGSALNFTAWNFTAAILNSKRYCGPQLHVAGRSSIEANNMFICKLLM